MYIDNYFIIKFEGSSKVAFNNNKADSDGGAMYINLHSTVTFEGNSKVAFRVE